MGRVNIVLEEDIHRQVKSASALEGTTLIDFVNRAIEQKLGRR